MRDWSHMSDKEHERLVYLRGLEKQILLGLWTKPPESTTTPTATAKPESEPPEGNLPSKPDEEDKNEDHGEAPNNMPEEKEDPGGIPPPPPLPPAGQADHIPKAPPPPPPGGKAAHTTKPKPGTRTNDLLAQIRESGAALKKAPRHKPGAGDFLSQLKAGLAEGKSKLKHVEEGTEEKEFECHGDPMCELMASIREAKGENRLKHVDPSKDRPGQKERVPTREEMEKQRIEDALGFIRKWTHNDEVDESASDDEWLDDDDDW
eukprot:gnl/TRDRNA2_/TRDRNA2_141309_c1_seq1.p1 gnl/TRDRNA2_/TRDRNA2_141309_c1~~gnl/TRDRNA2_/TRDRNA2_141309_c1_seq1.p1  ORF type:complete len:262 (-),score=62.33 gnl/TRDRNA2_/TRDRNA2_141309_c1_seq1:121-906(-)